MRKGNDEEIQQEVSELMLNKKSIKKETSLGKLRNINGKFACIIVTVFVISKLSGISIVNTYIGNVFFKLTLRLQWFFKLALKYFKRLSEQQKKHYISGYILWDKCIRIQSGTFLWPHGTDSQFPSHDARGQSWKVIYLRLKVFDISY